jgi:hypothetical protein
MSLMIMTAGIYNIRSFARLPDLPHDFKVGKIILIIKMLPNPESMIDIVVTSYSGGKPNFRT